MKKRIITLAFMFLLAFSLINYTSAQQNTVCCERTQQGAFCQDVPVEECDPNYRQLPTSCDSTSFCRAGTCFDSGQGTCLDNTPQLVCNNNGGFWSDESPPQCELGCCILGDQAAYVSLVRCKYLSAQLGLETNYDKTIPDELSCIAAVQSQDKGACIYEHEFERTCKFTTKAECDGASQTVGNGTQIVGGEFFKDRLCTDEELGTNCGPTTQTTTIEGKDGVYFVDTCGNPANIYDATKINDKEYWSTIKGIEESCGYESSNALNPSCGNCNYVLGSFARHEDVAGRNPTYGDYICADLNCKSTGNGQSYLHGESWCVNNDAGETGEGDASTGSEFFRHICINGEEVVEACDGFRQETCIEDDINGFAQAACRVNRWQDCTSQLEKLDCENTDRRDCLWVEGTKFAAYSGNTTVTGSCIPKNPPGLKFWEGTETQNICGQGTFTCIVTYEKGIFGGNQCKDNCECLSDEWITERTELCVGLGDCGPGVNWFGQRGYKEGFNVTVGDPEDLGIEVEEE